MDETKEQLQLLIGFFTGPFSCSLSFAEETRNEAILDSQHVELSVRNIDLATTGGLEIGYQLNPIKSLINKKDITTIIKTLNLCKQNLVHFSDVERRYLVPLMALCGHTLLTELSLISRSHLNIISDILIYILQLLLNEIDVYHHQEENDTDERESNDDFQQLSTYLQKQLDDSLSNYETEEYFEYFLKYRLIKFINFMLLDNFTNSFTDNGEMNAKVTFFTDQELFILCQMLLLKPMPDSLRFHPSSLSASALQNQQEMVMTRSPPPPPPQSLSNPVTIISSQSSVKRVRLMTTPTVTSALGAFASERNSKEEFFDQLLTPFIVSNTATMISNSPNSTFRTLPSVSSDKVANQESSKNQESLNAVKNQSVQQIKIYLISQNQMFFQFVGNATSILNLLQNNTILRFFIGHLSAIEEGAQLRFDPSRFDLNQLDLICDRFTADIDLVATVFAFNRLLEPLSFDRISKMIVIVQACLYGCVSLILHHGEKMISLIGDQENDHLLEMMAKIEVKTLEIIEKCLSLYDRLFFDIFRQSNRVPGHISQNAHMFTCWLLFSSLEVILTSTKKISSSLSSKRQGYCSLCIPLLKHALKLFSCLLDDLHLDKNSVNLDEDESATHSVVTTEALTLTDQSTQTMIRDELGFLKKITFTSMNRGASNVAPTFIHSAETETSRPLNSSMQTSARSVSMNTFKYHKFGHYSAWQRIDMIVSSNLNVIHLLFSYLSAGYRRATLLRHSSFKLPQAAFSSPPPSSGSVFSSFDETEFSSTKKTLEISKSNKGVEEEANLRNSFEINSSTLIDFDVLSTEVEPDKSRINSLQMDIDNHYELVISIIDHLNFYFICSKIEALRSYFKQMFTEAQMIVLAHIIQDLDSEMENFQSSLSPLSSKTFVSFSSSLTSLMHNLVAMQLLTIEQQNSLLAYLSFKPSLDPECLWPLHHGSRSLAILAQIILLRQQKEEEEIKLDLNSITIQIWRGFINKLKQAALSFKGELTCFDPECPDFQEDLNVEHAQLMLFLFHNLKLLQRKHVFSLIGLALHEISMKLTLANCLVSAGRMLFLGRLLHLFEYMCKNLYDTPSYLFEQINHNLLNLRPVSNNLSPQQDDLFANVSLENLENFPDTLRNIKFIADKKLELNYFHYLFVSNSNSKKTKKTDVDNSHSLNSNLLDFILHPRFYHLMDVSAANTLVSSKSLLRSFKPKLDGIACSFMLAGFSPLTYDQFHQSLLNLFNLIGYQYDFDLRQDSGMASEERFPQYGPFGTCALDYTFQTMWRLVNQLPPSLRSLSDTIDLVQRSSKVAENQPDSSNNEFLVQIDAARLINLCIWAPRLESNRPISTWISDLFSKLSNQVELSSNADFRQERPSFSVVQEIISGITENLKSLDFNYALLKCLSWSFFRCNHQKSNQLALLNHLGQQQQLYSFQCIQFPKFFTVFAIDLFFDRLVSFFDFGPTKHLLKNSKKSLSPSSMGMAIENINSENIEKFSSLLLNLFDKIFSDIVSILLYEQPLVGNAGRQTLSDINFLFYRSLVALSGTNSYDSNVSDLSTTIVDSLPQSMLAKIDQWNRLYVNKWSIDDATTLVSTTLPTTAIAFQKGILFEVPLIEIPTIQQASSSLNHTAVKQSNNLYHFSSFMNEKHAIIDTPNVVSLQTGHANLTWIKLKQFWIKMFRFIEFLYSKKENPQLDDLFVNYYLSLQLNLVSSSLLIHHSGNGESLKQTSLSYQVMNKLFDLKIGNETYCSRLYGSPFLPNVFFILTIMNHSLFQSLDDASKLKHQKIFQDCSVEFFAFFSKLLKRPSGRIAFEDFLCRSSSSNVNAFSLVNLIEIASHSSTQSSYAINLMKFIKTLFSQSEKAQDDASLNRLCSSLMSSLASHPNLTKILTDWFNLVLFHRNDPKTEYSVSFTGDKTTVQQSTNDFQFFIDDSSNANIYLFFKFICYVIRELPTCSRTNSNWLDETVILSIADAVIANTQLLIKSKVLVQSQNVHLYFSGLFTSLVYLMSAAGNTDSQLHQHSPSGHFKLIQEVIVWLIECKSYLSKKEVLKKIRKSDLMGGGRQRFWIESCFQMLSYLSDIFNAFEWKYVSLLTGDESMIKSIDDKEGNESARSPVSYGYKSLFIDDEEFSDQLSFKNLKKTDIREDFGNVDYDVQDDEQDFDLDDEEELANQLCTFTITQREFINQHWYHCHTCKMLDGVGVCTVCAKVCHRGHDVTYSKHGSFFCDCGANENGSCKALVKRAFENRKKTDSSNANPNKRSLSAKSNDEIRKNLIDDQRKLFRISKYWYTAFYNFETNFSKLSDNFKFLKKKSLNPVLIENHKRFGLQFENFDNYVQLLINYIVPISDHVLELIEHFVPILEYFFFNDSELGFLSNIRKEFQCFQSIKSSLSLEKSDKLLSTIKCWPEPLFENVQIGQSEHLQSVRHLTLITGAVVKRVSMLVLGASSYAGDLATPYPCLLAVAHDKNLLSIIQLNSLLDQVYGSNSKKKLALQRIANITFPFTIMTMSHNPLNDELLAVCGLKECHILSLARNGAITGHYSLSMSFDSNNHIIKAFWFPDSQTELAIVTLNFIKVFDLSHQDRNTPVYNFVIPSRKIRDMTFFLSNSMSAECASIKPAQRFILVFSSRGHIYAQELNVDSQCSSLNDVFYVTSIINVKNSSESAQSAVGFSIYFSHLLQTLFVSYLNGKSFCTPFSLQNIYSQQIDQLTILDLSFSVGSISTSSTTITSQENNDSSNSQPLFQWMEVLAHPGLVFALAMNTNNPVCFMFKSNSIKWQELRPKRKVIDFAAVSTTPFPTVGSSQKYLKMTTLLALCDDGTLRFYRASNEQTNFWMKPHICAVDDMPNYSTRRFKSIKATSVSSKKHNSSKTALSLSTGDSAKSIRFPVDFFERCPIMNEIEFGGSDVLEVYNTQQIKSRLGTVNMYIACTKSNGFSMLVTQTGTFNLSMAGIRVNLGVPDPARAPTAIEIFNRSIPVAINRHRWFDIPFTRTEMKTVAEQNTFNIRFAPSGDPSHVTIVDSIRVHGRPRYLLGLNQNGSEEEQTVGTGIASQPNESGVLDQSSLKLLSRCANNRLTNASATKSPLQKLRLSLYSPTITDDELVLSLDPKYQGIFVLNRLLANSLDVLEALFSFSRSLHEKTLTTQHRFISTMARDLTQSNEFQKNCDIAISIVSKLFTISLSSRLDKSICLLMVKLLGHRSAYDEHRDEIIFENAIGNLKKYAYDDINVFCYNFGLFREIVQERPRNFIKFIGKYFSSASNIAAMQHAPCKNATHSQLDVQAFSILQFCSYLNDLFWRLYGQRPANELLAPLSKLSYFTNIDAIVDSLVFVFYSSMYALMSGSESFPDLSGSTTPTMITLEQQQNISKTSKLIMQFLASSDPEISFSTKKALFRIVYSISSGMHSNLEKQAKKVSSSGRVKSALQPNSSSHSSRVTNRNHHRPAASSTNEAKHLQASTTPSTSGQNVSHLRRQGARHFRSSSNNNTGSNLWLRANSSASNTQQQRQQDQLENAMFPSSSARSGRNRSAASFLERVTESLLDNDFDPYHNLLLNLDNEFPYFHDLMANLRREQELEDLEYEEIEDDDEDDDEDDQDDQVDNADNDDDEDDDQDDDDDDDDQDDDDDDHDDDDHDDGGEEDELVLPSINQSEQIAITGSSSSAPPPLFPDSSFLNSSELRNNGQMEEILNVTGPDGEDEGVRIDNIRIDEDVDDDDVDDDDVEDDDDDDEDEDFEAMDEDAMMEIAIALSLQEQQQQQQQQQHEHGNEPNVVEEMMDFNNIIQSRELNHFERQPIEEVIDDDEYDDQHHLADNPRQSPQASGSGSSRRHYSISLLPSESDDDDEELFCQVDETNYSNIVKTKTNAELEEDHAMNEEELTTVPSLSMGSKLKSKSNDTLMKSKSESSYHPKPYQSTSAAAIFEGVDRAGTSKIQPQHPSSCQKSRKRFQRLIASKFCLSLLNQMCQSLPDCLAKLDGVQAIPFLQVLVLLADFNYPECDQKEFGMLFSQLIQKLLDRLLKKVELFEGMDMITPTSILLSSNCSNQTVQPNKTFSSTQHHYRDRLERTPDNEVLLLIIRLFSLFLSYFKRYPSIDWSAFMSSELPITVSNLICQSNSTPIDQQSSSSSSTCSLSKSVTFDEEKIKTASGSTLSPKNFITQVPSPTTPSVHLSLLITATHIINSSQPVLGYCFALLQQLLKQYWSQLCSVESENDEDSLTLSTNNPPDRNKFHLASGGHSIVYHSKKPIKIRPHSNFIPSDLKPFFAILPEVFVAPTSAHGTNSTTAASVQASVTNHLVGLPNLSVSNNATNSGSTISNTCTALNSMVFSNNVFDRYDELLTEMSLRIPYQMKKLIFSLNSGQPSMVKVNENTETATTEPKPPSIQMEFDLAWIEVLCEYMMLPSVSLYIRKQVRKLLLSLCGSKEKYRQVRDYYAIKKKLRSVKSLIVMHFFDHSSSNNSTTNNAPVLKIQDLGLANDALEDEDQLDELIRVIVSTLFMQNDGNSAANLDHKSTITMMMMSDQHRLLNLPYAQLVKLVDYLKACLDIANARVNNWHRLCRREMRIIPFLFRISFLFGEGISSMILQLLSLALFSADGKTTPANARKSSGKTAEEMTSLTNTLLMSCDKKVQIDSNRKESKIAGSSYQSFICYYVFYVLDRKMFLYFIRYFLLESNSSQQRWAAHSLLHWFFESLPPLQQEQLLAMFWQLWPSIASYGKRASQFVDLLGYFTLVMSRQGNNDGHREQKSLTENERLYLQAAIGLLCHQNQVLIQHPNSNIYESFQSLLEFNGYYLETEPCLVCNNPEVNFIPLKLFAIKLDSRFTTNTQIVKLIGSHTISKINVKISELKKSKMVKTLSIYYNNRWVQSVVELKNKNTVWNRAKRITLTPSQAEVKIEFALPIVACNLMIEYSSFFETAHSSTETLQCPRCSSIVPANPGVCTNCGENVFQCHKCRAINYDEKDPFLCNSCGFCKYAKFDYVLTARYTASAVETIENEEDRMKAVQTINNLLEKADRLYKVILSIRPTLESLFVSSQDSINFFHKNETEHSSVSAGTANGAAQLATSATSATIANATGSSPPLYVNRYIHQLATRYCNECRVNFEELSKIVQKILYTRKELVDYDNRQSGARQSFDEIKRLLQERRQQQDQNQSLVGKPLFSGSTTSLSSSSSSTLIDLASIRKQTLNDDSSFKQVTGKKVLNSSVEDEMASLRDLINDEDFKSGKCYGCASATIEHCIILLKALAHNPMYKTLMSSSNLFRELIDYNLRIGPPAFRAEVRLLLCLLTRDNPETTEQFNRFLLEKIQSTLKNRYMTSFDFASIRHEMGLLASSFENEDQCWEQRLRCVMKLFLLSLQNKSPAVLESITLPCLRILYGLVIKPNLEAGKKSSEQVQHLVKKNALTVEHMASVHAPVIEAMCYQQKKSFTPLGSSLAFNVTVDLGQWLMAENNRSLFSAWQSRNLRICRNDFPNDRACPLFEEAIQRKYFSRWLWLFQNGKLRAFKSESLVIRIASSNWIQEVLFNPTSKALRVACRQLLMALFDRLTSKQRVLLDLLTSFLDDLCRVGGEIGLEFYDLYRSIVFNEFSIHKINQSGGENKNFHWRYYLTLCGLLKHLGHLVANEIDRLKQLEKTTLNSDFSQGSALRQLVELLQLFMRDERIRQMNKSNMVGFVLDGYLSLRKLIVQRTKMIDEAQSSLLDLLEVLTTGTKTETINFMKVCIESVKKCSSKDLRTPVFIFERLCSIIHPEEKDADEFFISLEKDSQQEDFLQGRMLGNPYSSKDSGMGPLMRDIKNKICQECELVSLLEDDSGLELLVNNKIISLDLPVKEVYKKIVCADAAQSVTSNSSWPLATNSSSSGGVFSIGSNLSAISGANSGFSGPTMKIVYRIRGLMGDATEEFIQTLNNKESIVEDDEKVFELANIMSQAGGLNIMLERLETLTEISNQSRNFLFVLIKLFGYCVRVNLNRKTLIQPELDSIGIMLGTVRLFLRSQQSELLTTPAAPGEPSYFEQLLIIMDTILTEASQHSSETFDQFNRQTCGSPEDVQLLLDSVAIPESIICSGNVSSLVNKILRLITFLVLGHPEKMAILVQNFRPYFEFDQYDGKNLQVHNAEHWYELFCCLVSAIEPNQNGARLKDFMIKENFVLMAIDYLVRNAPPMNSFVLLNSEEWKDFTSKAALKFVLKMLTGFCRGHERSQLLIAKDGVPIIHALEQVLSDSHMATLAENLMDALKENPSVEAKIKQVRLKTREEKKRIAMAVREKQLGELGMKANEKGQVMADVDLLKKMDDQLNEEKGLVCSICREGYSYQPQKVLAIYTFTKRCNVDEAEERKPRKTIGYSTVTHFNIVHVECHMDAVRHARTRDEWQSAALHNANTRCNGLLPLWGPNVYESLFAHSLSRHNSYLQDAVGQRDFVGTNSFLGTVHDLKLLLFRFADERSFSDETGGGGAQSNLYLMPYLIHTALYVINTTKLADRERSNLDENFMQQTSSKWIESCFQVDSAYFYSIMVLLLQSQRFWATHRLFFLRRLIICALTRSLPTDSRQPEIIAAVDPVPFPTIKPALMFFSLVNLLYTIMFKSVEIKPDSDWPQSLADYIRHNDQPMMEAADKILETFENDLLPSTSFAEFCDAADLLRVDEGSISDCEKFLRDALKL